MSKRDEIRKTDKNAPKPAQNMAPAPAPVPVQNVPEDDEPWTADELYRESEALSKEAKKAKDRYEVLMAEAKAYFKEANLKREEEEAAAKAKAEEEIRLRAEAEARAAAAGRFSLRDYTGPITVQIPGWSNCGDLSLGDACADDSAT